MYENESDEYHNKYFFFFIHVPFYGLDLQINKTYASVLQMKYHWNSYSGVRYEKKTCNIHRPKCFIVFLKKKKKLYCSWWGKKGRGVYLCCYLQHHTIKELPLFIQMSPFSFFFSLETHTQRREGDVIIIQIHITNFTKKPL